MRTQSKPAMMQSKMPRRSLRLERGRKIQRGENDVVYERGREIQRGENGVVYECRNHPRFVIKEVAESVDSADIQREVDMQHMMACLEVAPRIVDSTDGRIVMERIDALGTLNTRDQSDVIEIVLKSVANGLLHNDLHHGNMGRIDGRVRLIDFGLTKQIDPPTDQTVYLQLVIAQLYALVDPCNTNNVQNLCMDPGPIVDAIYFIRQGETTLDGQNAIEWMWEYGQNAMIARCQNVATLQ